MRKISVVFYCTLILIVVSCHSCKGSKQKKEAVSVNDSIINQVKVDSSSKLKVDTIVGPGEKNDFVSSKMFYPWLVHVPPSHHCFIHNCLILAAKRVC